MADNINIQNLEAGRDACDSLQKIAQDTDILKQTSMQAFTVLNTINPDLGTNFNNQLSKSLEDIYKFLKEDIFSTADKYYQKEGPDDGGDGDNGGNGGGGYYGPTPGGTIPDTVPDTIPDSVPITEPEKDIIDSINLKGLEEVKLSDLYGLMIQFVGLVDPEKETLEKVFESDVNDDKIKQIVLDSPYVPEDLKKQLIGLDSKIVKQLIYNILSGKNPEIFKLNNLNKVSLYKYLETVAMINETTVDDLLNNPEKAQLLKEAMAGLDDAVELIKGWEEQTNETFQEQLKMFYFGDVPQEFPDQDIYVSRAYVDYLATECDIQYEELLNDSSYAEVLKRGAQEFGKSLTFFNSTGFLSKENTQATVKNTLKDIVVKERKFDSVNTVSSDNATSTSGTSNIQYIQDDTNI